MSNKFYRIDPRSSNIFTCDLQLHGHKTKKKMVLTGLVELKKWCQMKLSVNDQQNLISL